MEHNPFMPGDSPFDARGRLREGFSHKDFVAGTSTLRVSQNPPGDEPHLPKPAQPSAADIEAARMTASRPLPVKVLQEAERLGISPTVATFARATYGGPFSEARIVKYLTEKFPNDVTTSSATDLVRSVRSAQNDTTRLVKSEIAKARAVKDSEDNSTPTFSKEAWTQMKQSIDSSQSAFDSDTSRALFKVASDPQFHVDRGHNLQVIEGIKDQLLQAGYDKTHVVDQLPASEFRLGDRHMTMTGVDSAFAHRIAQTGLGSTQATGRLGVVDFFHPYTHPTSLVNATFIQTPFSPATSDHGHSVASIAGQGLGQWGNLSLENGIHARETRRAVDRMAKDGVKTINISTAEEYDSSGEIRREMFTQHPGIKFVVAAGNDASHLEHLPPYSSPGRDLDNVTYVGNVDLQSVLHPQSNTGDNAIYAFGHDRPVARVAEAADGFVPEQGRFSGTSSAAPEVANLYHQMDFLNPGLTPAQAKRIVFDTARPHGVTGAADGRGGVLPVINRFDAITVAALGGLMNRQLRPPARQVTRPAPDDLMHRQPQQTSPDGTNPKLRSTWTAAPSSNPLSWAECADILRLTSDERTRLLPLAVESVKAQQDATSSSPLDQTRTDSISRGGDANSTPQSVPTAPNRTPPHPIDMALKMRLFSSSAQAISDPARFNTYLGHLDGQPISMLMRVGQTGVGLNEFSLVERTHEYRSVSTRKLVSALNIPTDPQMAPLNSGKAHEVHTVFGAASKVGEVNASGISFGALTSNFSSWEERGGLPGAGGQALGISLDSRLHGKLEKRRPRADSR